MWTENKLIHYWWGYKLEQNFEMNVIILAKLKNVHTFRLKYELLRAEANTFLRVKQQTKKTMSDSLEKAVKRKL